MQTTEDYSAIECLASECLAPLFWPPKRARSAWCGHVAFGHWIIHVARPKVLVELGTHSGVSYSAFCEAVAKTGASTRCFAVDTWKGDKHLGFYQEDVFQEFKEFHDFNFKSFSKILRKTFDDAVAEFDDKSIDIVHFDGLHTYDAVRHDFETWLPKLSEGAVALFHDTNERRDDFGVWRFWSEIRQKYPAFEFLHSHGLGVLCVGSAPPAQVLALCSMDSAERIATIRDRFEAISVGWSAAERLVEIDKIQTAELATRDAKILTLQSENEAYVGRIRAQSDQIATLDQRVRQAQGDIEQIRSSTSWLITAPMRFLVTSGRSLTRRLAAPSLVSAISPASAVNLNEAHHQGVGLLNLPGQELNAIADRYYAEDGTRKPITYFAEYERILSPRRNQPLGIIELGVFSGASMLVWRDYLPNATIVGLDSAKAAPAAVLADSRLNFVSGQQDDDQALAEAVRLAGGQPWLIIDDCSHIARVTKRSFAYLFDRLAPGGSYVIEDICTSFLHGDFDDGQTYREPPMVDDDPNIRIFPSHTNGLVGFVKQLIDHVQRDVALRSYKVLPIERIIVLGNMAIIQKSA